MFFIHSIAELWPGRTRETPIPGHTFVMTFALCLYFTIVQIAGQSPLNGSALLRSLPAKPG